MAKQKTNDAAPAHTSTKRQMLLGRARLISLLVLVGLLAATLVFLWVTRDAMEQLSFLRAKGQQAAQQGSQTLDGHKTLVDLRPWQTAVTLTALAVTNCVRHPAGERTGAEEGSEGRISCALAKGQRSGAAGQGGPGAG
jgi:hypothetical protein